MVATQPYRPYVRVATCRHLIGVLPRVRSCCGRDHQRHPRGHGQELAAVGCRLSIEAVARRAGVGKTAIYRRWSTKLEMVLELVTEVAWLPAPLPDTGSLRADLELVLGLAARALCHRLASQIIPDLMAETARNPQIVGDAGACPASDAA
jgi:hypothetical protein